MIFGIGTDIADCNRVGSIYAKHGHHFVKNILTPAELERMAQLRDPKEFIAGRWAAKEAFSKALLFPWKCRADDANSTQLNLDKS